MHTIEVSEFKIDMRVNLFECLFVTLQFEFCGLSHEGPGSYFGKIFFIFDQVDTIRVCYESYMQVCD